MSYERVLNETRLKAIRCLTCVVCANPEVVAHHLIGQGFGGMGTKASDDLTIPLCQTHHAELHLGIEHFESKFGTQEFLLDKTNRWLSIAREL